MWKTIGSGINTRICSFDIQSMYTKIRNMEITDLITSAITVTVVINEIAQK
jgi:hypothetical protein